jgi:type I restriction enzyme, S subunit
MAGEWIDTTLGGVLTFQRGFDLPETERKPGPYPVIASTGPVGTHLEATVKGPGVVIGRSGSLGGGQYIAGDFWPLNTTLWVKDFKGNDRRFCYYLIKSLDLAQFNAGSGVPTLNRNHIHPIPLSVPKDPTEQRAIAHILGTLDDKIELNRRMNATLEAMARAIFKSWFIDFDPVRRNAARARNQPSPDASRHPLPVGEGLGEGSVDELLPSPRGRRAGDEGGIEGLDALFPHRFENSELGQIPAGWEAHSLDEIANYLNGLVLQKFPPNGDESLPAIKIAQLHAGHTKGADRVGTNLPPEYVIEDGDVLFSWSGSLEVEIWCGGRGALNQHLFKLTSRNSLSGFITCGRDSIFRISRTPPSTKLRRWATFSAGI